MSALVPRCPRPRQSGADADLPHHTTRCTLSPSPRRDDLAGFASALAQRLPGPTWTSTYTRHKTYPDQIPTTNQVWDAGAIGHAASDFVLGHQAVLSRVDGPRLLVFDRPRFARQFMVGALVPEADPDAFHLVAEPNGITVPADPGRAASQVAHRLLPRFEAALEQVRRNTENPIPRRPAPPLLAGRVSMAWYPDGVVGAVSGAEGAADALYSSGFGYHPYDRMFILSASYGDREQIARIQAASQRLDRLGIGVVVRPAPTPAPLTSKPAVVTPRSQGAPARTR
ncbi:hypothetical protein OTB20_18810 [Streptomyces sp. H27-H1]|uniref:hypothetical protein n=1 Tax=Streptomyces sp. H27-H1 TaxID=2996461 RepID=UPI00226E68E9|nr:hypothetical protein [Streptomyces sp. H27-H1]MCY0928209.1 hypothetical protein [Streptomyces sp. H27-H1]